MEYELVLTHHGIKGQRWGVRRFQTKSGGLTSAGRKRYGVGKDSDKKSAKKEEASKRKSVSEMSDDELRRAIDRARQEDTYRQLRPEKVSATKRLVSTLGTKVIAPAAINAGEQFLRKYLNKLGDDILGDKTPPSEKERLTKENELLRLRNENKELKKSSDDKLSWADKLKKQTYEKNAAKEAAEEYKTKLEYEKSKLEFENWMKENRSNSAVPNEPMSSAANSATADAGRVFIAGLLEPPKNR